MKVNSPQSSLFILLLFIFLMACNSKHTSTAKIFERKHIDKNRLLIKYKYIVGEHEYTDSTTIENQVLNSDTISISYNESSPGKATPELKKL